MRTPSGDTTRTWVGTPASAPPHEAEHALLFGRIEHPEAPDDDRVGDNIRRAGQSQPLDTRIGGRPHGHRRHGRRRPGEEDARIAPPWKYPRKRAPRSPREPTQEHRFPDQ